MATRKERHTAAVMSGNSHMISSYARLVLFLVGVWHMVTTKERNTAAFIWREISMRPLGENARMPFFFFNGNFARDHYEGTPSWCCFFYGNFAHDYYEGKPDWCCSLRETHLLVMGVRLVLLRTRYDCVNERQEGNTGQSTTGMVKYLSFG